MNEKTVVLIAVGILLLVGIILFSVAAGIHIYTKKKMENCTATTTATIIDLECRSINASPSDINANSWFPTFEYYVGGNRIERPSNVGGPKGTYQIGQKITLNYNPQNVKEIYVPSQNLGLIVKLLGAMGAIFIIGALVVGKILL